MFNTTGIIFIIENTILLILFFYIERKYRASLSFQMNFSQDKKNFWERVLSEQEIKNTSTIIQSEPSQQEVIVAIPSPKQRKDQPWFIERFFFIYFMRNYCHVFWLVRSFNKEWNQFSNREHWNYIQALILPLIAYQLIMHYFYFGLPLAACMNILVQHYRYKYHVDIEESMSWTCLKINHLNELVPQTQTDQQQIFNLAKYGQSLASIRDKTGPILIVIFAYLFALNVQQTAYVSLCGFLIGMTLEQAMRFGFVLVYSKYRAKRYILDNESPLPEMSALRELYHIPKSSPEKYMLQKEATVSCFTKEHSMIHQSTNEILLPRCALRVTSANIGNTEDTKLDVTQDSQIRKDTPLDSHQNNNQLIPLPEVLPSNEFSEAKVFKKKTNRIKLESLYHSRNSQNQSPSGVIQPQAIFYSSNKKPPSLKQQSPPEFNPIQILQHLSPIHSNSQRSSQRQQFPNIIPNNFDEDKEIQFDELSHYNASTPRNQLKVISNTIQSRVLQQSLNNSIISKRNNSYKTSKEEEENSYNQQRKIKVNSLKKTNSPIKEAIKRRRSTGTKDNKPRGDSLNVKKRTLDDVIPILNFDSERFKNSKSPYLEYLPNMLQEQQQQKTTRKQVTNKKAIKQMLDNNQTSNENRHN